MYVSKPINFQTSQTLFLVLPTPQHVGADHLRSASRMWTGSRPCMLVTAELGLETPSPLPPPSVSPPPPLPSSPSSSLLISPLPLGSHCWKLSPNTLACCSHLTISDTSTSYTHAQVKGAYTHTLRLTGVLCCRRTAGPQYHYHIRQTCLVMS